jgi:NADPH:quinone reductase-like Zn-dependent oxidoreductase
MKAIVYEKYGPPEVLQLKEVEKPTPKDNEVLIKVHAASVNYADWAFVRGKPFLVRLMGAELLKPKNKVLGIDVAGRIEAVGANVTQFQVDVWPSSAPVWAAGRQRWRAAPGRRRKGRGRG